jgi:hypothetical protein
VSRTTESAYFSIPGLPGVQNIFFESKLSLKALAIECSLPPDPIKSMFILFKTIKNL